MLNCWSGHRISWLSFLAIYINTSRQISQIRPRPFWSRSFEAHPFHMSYQTAHNWYRIHSTIFYIFHTENRYWYCLEIVFPTFRINAVVLNIVFLFWTFLEVFFRLAFVRGIFVPNILPVRFFSSAAFLLLVCSCDVRMVALSFFCWRQYES
jgi:hypothetical protein